MANTGRKRYSKSTPKKEIKTEETKMPEKKIKIVGNAVVLTSKLKFATIQKMEKYSKDALALIDYVDDERVETFRISTGKISSVSKYGIVFAEVNKKGYAVATVLLPEGVTDKRTYVKDSMGVALFSLAELEAAVEEASEAIEKAYAELDEDIEEVE